MVLSRTPLALGPHELWFSSMSRVGYCSLGFLTPVPFLYTQVSPPQLFSGSPSEILFFAPFTHHNFPQKGKKNTVLKKKKDWETKGTWGQTTEWWIEKLQAWLLNRYCAWQMCMMSRHVQVRNQPVHQTHRAVLTFKWRVLASFMSLKFYMAGILKLWYNMGLLQRRFTIIKNYLCEDVFISYLFFSEIRIIKIDHF